MGEGSGQVGGQPVDKAVDVGRLDQRCVVPQPDRPALVVDADEQGSSVGVQEPRDCLDDGVLHPPVLDALVQVPASGGFELHGERLVAGDQLGARDREEGVLAPELLGDPLGEPGVGANLLEHRPGDLVDIDLRRIGAGGDGPVRSDGDGRLARRTLVVDAAAVVVVAGEDVVEDRVALALPGLRVVGVRQLVEYVADQDASGLAGLGLAAPVEHEAVGDVRHQLARDLLDLRALARLSARGRVW